MNRKSYQAAFSVSQIVVMVALLSTIFFASVNLASAAAVKKQSTAVTRVSAVDHTEAQIKQLQGALKITKDQEGLWITLTQVMRENAKEMDALTKADSTKTMNGVEHMKLHRELTEAHLAQLNKFIPPFEALYSGMSDAQKQSTDKIFQTGASGRLKKK